MRHSLITSLALCFLLSSGVTFAEMDVDDADSLRFQSFHEKKDGGIKIYDAKKGGLTMNENKEAKKVYGQSSMTEKSPAPASTTSASKTEASISATNATLPKGNKGQRFEIRERYTLGRSTATPYSTFHVTEALHKQMATLCSNGWEIIREFSIPVENDFYMHYEFECL